MNTFRKTNPGRAISMMIAAGLLCAATSAGAQQKIQRFADVPPATVSSAPQKIQLSELSAKSAEVSSLVRAVIIMDPDSKFIVEGDTEVKTWWVAAREIIFKPGARLVFPESVYGQSRELFIVADKITLEDPGQPPSILWKSPSPRLPDARGQAANGVAGNGEGAGGSAGVSGAIGSAGSVGIEAPSLTVMSRSLNGALLVDFRGGPGGDGGAGQRGGDGGAGVQGGPASQARGKGPFGVTLWEPWCDSGPGQGGAGGSGGNGGVGGTGGVGGRGGSVTFVSTPEAVPTFTQLIKADVAGGFSGNGGSRGDGGTGGAGGSEGPLANYCNSAGRNGAPGALGQPGIVGQKGDPGISGRVYVAQLDAEKFKLLFGF